MNRPSMFVAAGILLAGLTLDAYALGLGGLGIGKPKTAGGGDDEAQAALKVKRSCEQGLQDLRNGMADVKLQAYDKKLSDIEETCGQAKKLEAQTRCRDKAKKIRSERPVSAKAAEYEQMAKARQDSCESLDKTKASLISDYLTVNELIVKSLVSAGEAMKVSGDYAKKLKAREELEAKAFQGKDYQEVTDDVSGMTKMLVKKSQTTILSSETGPTLLSSISMLIDALNMESALNVLVKPFAPPVDPSEGVTSKAAGKMFSKEPLEVALSSWVPKDWDENKKLLQALTRIAAKNSLVYPAEADAFKPAPGLFSLGIGKLSAVAKSLMASDFEGVTGPLRLSYELAGQALGVKEAMLKQTAAYDSFESGTIDDKMFEKHVEIGESATKLLSDAATAAGPLTDESKVLLKASQDNLKQAFTAELTLAGTAALYGYMASSGDPGAVVAGVQAFMLAKGIPSDLARMKRIMDVYNAIAKTNKMDAVALGDPTALLGDIFKK